MTLTLIGVCLENIFTSILSLLGTFPIRKLRRPIGGAHSRESQQTPHGTTLISGDKHCGMFSRYFAVIALVFDCLGIVGLSFGFLICPRQFKTHQLIERIRRA